MRNFILFFGILILFSFNINANFVCGIVENSDDGMSGAWFNTRLFYENYSSNFLNCQVSPKENKYCCDADSIYPQNTWKVGKKVFARVYDFNTGYFADEVNVITTGRAYDIFPNLKLKKAIKVNDPVSRVIISKENNLSLNLSFCEPYNLIEIRDENSLLFNCDNCTFFNDSLNLSFGENKINVFAKKINNESFQEVINVALNEENILVYKVVPVSLPKFSFSSDSSEGSSGWGRPPAKKNESSKNQISPSHPLVIDLNDSFVKRLVIYPKTEMIVENFNLDSYFKENLIDGLIQIYSYDSSLIQDNFEKVGVEFKISKDFLLKNNFEKINLYTLDNGFSLANLSLYSEDDNNLYYRGFIEFKEGFAIAGVTNNSISEDLSNKVTGLSIFEEIDLKESFLFKFFIKIKNFFSEIKL